MIRYIVHFSKVFPTIKRFGSMFGTGTLFGKITILQMENELYTPWKINMEPKNGGLEDDFPFQTIFRFHVNFPGYKPSKIS